MSSDDNKLPQEVIDKEVPVFHRTKLSLGKKMDDIIRELEQCLEDMEANGWDNSHGNSLLDVKNHHLSQYLIDLADIIKCRVTGQSIRGSGTVERLVESRTVLEKIKPLEKKIQYSLDQILMDRADTEVNNEEDPNSFAPNLNNLASDNEHDDDEDSDSDADLDDVVTSQSGKYVAPHIIETKMETESRARRQEREKVRMLQKSEVLRDNTYDMSGSEQEEVENDPEFGHKNKAKRQRKDREGYEESHHVRLQLTKKEKFNERKRRQGNDFDQLTNFKSDFLADDPLDGNKKKRSRGKKRRRN